MARRYVSIKEVAARAGVSFQTASKVLNGGNVRVSAETAARIAAVADSLGYRPNSVAQSLVQRTTATIGLIAGDITDGALSQFAVSAERTARRHGQAVLVGNVSERGDDGAAVVQMLIDRRVDGLIAAAPQLEGDTEVADMLRRYVPAVSLSHVPGGGVPLVGSNHRDGAKAATAHLTRLGHTSIGTVTGPFRRHVVRSRLHGYEDALREAGIEPGEDLAVEADWTPGTAAAATRLLLQRAPALSAIFVHSDTMAIGVLSALAAAGRRVPADVAVVSCDDMPFAEYLVPALSSLRVPFAETGERAVELLLRSIGGDPPPEGPVLLPVELIVRDSCGGQRPAAARRSASRRKATAPPAAGPPATGMPSATAARSAEKEDQ
ncbi:MAG TPA: LacI family DNA-binding transcriptional regulator [Streptosporangiaceae bacterium]|jgi:LacI family transcriptional regulator